MPRCFYKTVLIEKSVYVRMQNNFTDEEFEASVPKSKKN